jgi:hypothetical protein
MKFYLLIMKHTRLLSASILLMLFASCTSTTIDEFRQGETGIESDESVVILGRRDSSDYETRSDFVSCVGEEMNSGTNAVNVVPEQEFVDAMFPWFEVPNVPSQIADGAATFEAMMAEDFIANKMNEFGIRYIVWLDGSTETSGRSGSLTCAIGPGGGGCFGLGTWEDDSNFKAEVWDVDALASVGTINTDATGQSYVPAFVVPIPLIARVEANACSRLATQLKEFVKGS